MIDNKTFSSKLNSLKIPGYISEIHENIFYNDYYMVFSDNVTYNQIKARQKDIELLLCNPFELLTINGCIVFRVSKQDRKTENTKSYFTTEIKKGFLPLVIGRNENGNKLYFDLVNCPHLLVAGSTGSGKSVFLNNCILSIIYGCKSSLCLIDVKRVEFSLYEDIPTLSAPIAYDTKSAKNLLKNLCYTMDNRYKKLMDYKCKNIMEYNEKYNNMQYITVVIDEIADLLLQDKTIEPLLIRLAQLGRASGIHLILATQRPDSTIISGLIRVNVPSRVCFAVQKSTDSRIILDCNGGENLKGRGDGLFKPVGRKDCIRFQAPYITTEEIIDIVNNIK